jgi:hypothetical protein
MEGKNILIMSVAQSLHNNMMSLFRLPLWFHDDYMCNCAWCVSFDEHKRILHWKHAWDALTKQKQN